MTLRPFSQQILRMTGAGTEPDPAVYCPMNGYIIDPDLPMTPEVTIPPGDTTEKIILVCNSSLDAAFSFFCTTSGVSQKYTTKVFDMAGNQRSTIDTVSNIQVDLTFTPILGTLYPDGLYYFKIIITPTIITNHLLSFAVRSRSGFASNGWPLIEAHFYTPYITTLTSALSTYCKKLKYIKFYSACDSLTSLGSFAGACDSLKECYLPSSMNALITAIAAFAGTSGVNMQLRILQWPTALPECTTMQSMFTYGGLTKMTSTVNPLPTSLPKLTSIQSMFEYNMTIEEIEIVSDMPKLTTASNFALWPRALKSLKFNCNLGSPTAYVEMQWFYGYNYDNLVEVMWPIIAYVKGSSQPTEGKQCYSLKTVTYPSEMHYQSIASQTSLFGQYDSNISLETITSIISGDMDYCQGINFLGVPKLTQFWQPKLKLFSAAAIGSLAYPWKLSSFECDWNAILTDNFYNGGILFNLRYCAFPAAEFDRIFNALPNVTGLVIAGWKQMYIPNNPGSLTCNKTIAVNKGWSVTVGGDSQPTIVSSAPAITAITSNTASSSGNLTLTGNNPCKVGLCWATTITPTINNSKTSEDTIIPMAFSHVMTGLLPNTTYYMRAYAQSVINTVYSLQVTFTTLP